jgi:hypothetical protein
MASQREILTSQALALGWRSSVTSSSLSVHEAEASAAN